jgi:plastocyanin
MKPRLLLLSGLLAASCGGETSPVAPGPDPSPSQPTFTITSSGVSPRELTVAPGARVLFINNDSRRHDMGSDPHPDHTDCPEINAVGLLNQGQRRETLNLVTPRTCGFHDHDSPDNAALKGRIVIR